MSVCIDISLSLSLSLFLSFFSFSFFSAWHRCHPWRDSTPWIHHSFTFLRVFCFFSFSPLNLYSIGISPSIYTFYTCDVCGRARMRACLEIAFGTRACAQDFVCALWMWKFRNSLSLSLSLSHTHARSHAHSRMLPPPPFFFLLFFK